MTVGSILTAGIDAGGHDMRRTAQELAIASGPSAIRDTAITNAVKGSYAVKPVVEAQTGPADITNVVALTVGSIDALTAAKRGVGNLVDTVAAEYAVPQEFYDAQARGIAYGIKCSVYVPAERGMCLLPSAKNLYKKITGRKAPEDLREIRYAAGMHGSMKGWFKESDRTVGIEVDNPLIELITKMHEYAHADGADELQANEVMFSAIGYLKDMGYAGMKQLESGLIIPENVPSRLERLAA